MSLCTYLKMNYNNNVQKTARIIFSDNNKITMKNYFEILHNINTTRGSVRMITTVRHYSKVISHIKI